MTDIKEIKGPPTWKCLCGAMNTSWLLCANCWANKEHVATQRKVAQEKIGEVALRYLQIKLSDAEFDKVFDLRVIPGIREDFRDDLEIIAAIEKVKGTA